MRALIARLSAIGDVVHTLPVLSALYRHGWQADWVVEPPARPLLEGHPHLTLLARAPPARAFDLRVARAAVRLLRVERYEAALDIQGLWKSAGWGRLARPERLIGYARAWRREPLSALLLDEAIQLPDGVRHVIDENLALLRPLGVEAVGSREFAFPDTAAQARAVEAALASAGLAPGGFALLNAGGGWPEKLWPPEGYGALARGLRQRGLRSLVAWGPGEEALADRVVAASEGAAERCFPTGLLELLELARRARLMVAADTGPLHLACAVGTPVVGIYGQTDPARTGPFSPSDVVVRREGRPDPRRRGRFLVSEQEMAAIPPDDVLEAVDRRLARGQDKAARAV